MTGGPVTLADMIREGKTVWAYCTACCRERDLDAASLPLPGETPVPEVGGRMLCDTGTAAGKLVFGIFAALAEFKRELISERTRAGLSAAKARGRKGGRKPKLTAMMIAGVRARLAADALLDRAALARELGVHRATLWRALERSA